jgi:hypothetical protein
MAINIYPDPDEMSLLNKIQDERTKLQEETNKLLEHSRNNLKLHMYSIFMTIMFFLLLIISSILVYATYNTLSKEPSPISLDSNGIYEAYQHDNYTVFSITKDFDIKQLVPITLNRELACKTTDGSSYTYDLPSVKMFLQPGHYKDSKKIITLPLRIPVGSICTLKTIASWSQKISWDFKYADLPDITFKIEREKLGHNCTHIPNEFTE